jgi:peptide chain release factor 2
LEKEVAQPGFWSKEKRSEILQKLSYLKEKQERWGRFFNQYQEVLALSELLREEHDEELEGELKRKAELLEKKTEKFRIELLLNGEYDQNNAILSVHSGAGGVDSCDWTQNLARMYLYWAKKKGYKTKVVEWVIGEEAGIKTATMIIEGKFAYGYLKKEVGVHRLVRLSPFDASNRRHTSFAAVDVIPETREVEIEVKENDLKIDTFRAGGPGGQHVNVTSSAVRITHLPTGITVRCEDERSQYRNKATAMRILKARLHNLYELEKEKEVKRRRKEKARIEWGSQVRSYILHPYTLVKDHRTGVEKTDIEGVLKGEIDEFIIASLEKREK